MTHEKNTTAPHVANTGILSRVLRDKRGNTLAIVGAALVPMVGMIGSGVDISRGYLAKARLQQACDAGALAARKTLAGNAITGGVLPSNVTAAANSFFNVNFTDGAYGTQNRTFSVAPTSNGNIKGTATVTVPTAIMKIFGKTAINLNVACTAELSISDIDVMFVLDTTGSMQSINSGDTVTRIQALKNSVLNFYDSVQSVASATSKVRYGFVPYSTTVNVGRILPEQYVRGGTAGETATYQSRRANYTTQRQQISQTTGTEYRVPDATTYVTLSNCNARDDAYPVTSADGYTVTTRSIRAVRRSLFSSQYSCFLTDTVTTYADVQVFSNWTYAPYEVPIRDYYLSTATSRIAVPLSDNGVTETAFWPGCIEEVGTVSGNSFTTGIPANAFAEQMDYIPTTNVNSKWKPMFWEMTYNRKQYGNRTVALADAATYGRAELDNYACPTASRKLTTYPKSGSSRNTDFVNYVNSLTTGGFTIHDTGLIWGARLISPTGLFAPENVSDRVSRHIIFMTDGQMDVRAATLSTWGVEQMQGNVWGTGTQISASSGDEVALENLHLTRMAAICSAIKNRNITLWVIAFGTTLTTPLSSCADSGKSFTAANQTQLNATFQQIASQIAELRLTQ